MKRNKRFTKDNICAIIVSYNPTQIILDNINSLCPQVDYVLVIDNGSEKKEHLERIKEKFNVNIMYLHENKGIAGALNKGIEWCALKGYLLVLTMDQDTILDDNAVSEMLIAMSNTGAHSVGINWDGTARKDEDVRYLITSGNLVLLESVLSIGGFDEQLFIDSVDFDFSLRLSDCGYKMLKAAKAKAKHQLGEIQGESNYTTHSVWRYYYIYRNHFYLTKKYWKNHKVFCLRKQLALVYDLINILLRDKEKSDKIKMLKRGYRDAKSMLY